MKLWIFYHPASQRAVPVPSIQRCSCHDASLNICFAT